MWNRVEKMVITKLNFTKLPCSKTLQKRDVLENGLVIRLENQTPTSLGVKVLETSQLKQNGGGTAGEEAFLSPHHGSPAASRNMRCNKDWGSNAPRSWVMPITLSFHLALSFSELRVPDDDCTGWSVQNMFCTLRAIEWVFLGDFDHVLVYDNSTYQLHGRHNCLVMCGSPLQWPLDGWVWEELPACQVHKDLPRVRHCSKDRKRAASAGAWRSKTLLRPDISWS